MMQREYSNAASACVLQSASSPPSSTSAPTITGTTTLGQTLTANTGTWTGSPTSHQYTWRRCTPTCTGIAGANAPTYTLAPADTGTTIQLLVWGWNAAGHGAATSAQTAAVHRATASAA